MMHFIIPLFYKATKCYSLQKYKTVFERMINNVSIV